jgi:hypothetical protein
MIVKTKKATRAIIPTPKIKKTNRSKGPSTKEPKSILGFPLFLCLAYNPILFLLFSPHLVSSSLS